MLCACSSLSIAQDTTKVKVDIGLVTDTAVTPEPVDEFKNQIDLIDAQAIIFHKDREARQHISVHKSEKSHLSLVPALGYTLQTGFAGVLSANIAFYTGDSAAQKLSSISANFTYSQYNQIILPLQINLWTKGNKYNFVTDWRYMKYPSTTYGLGGNTLITDGYTIDFSYVKLHQTIYKSFAKNFYAGLGYYLDYIWGIQELGLPANSNTVFYRYGKNGNEVASGVALRLLYDSRLNQINPDNGVYANIVYRPNYTFMGSDNNWQSLLLEFRKFIKLSEKSRHVLAFWSYNWLTLGGKTPYLLLPSTGWDDNFNTGRGYIQGRFRGRNMIYLEAEYRFDITSNGLFGGVLFANAQAFSSSLSSSVGTISPGWGTGIRLKLNKFSGANLCIDYGFGLEGSRGFFVNLNEVF